MAHWDTSGLLKLFLAEADSADFEALAAQGGLPPQPSSPGTRRGRPFCVVKEKARCPREKAGDGIRICSQT